MQIKPIIALLLLARLPLMTAEPIDRPTAIELHAIAKRMANAMLQGDYAVTVDAMPPVLIEQGGGPDAVMQATLGAMDDLASQGFRIESYTTEPPTEMFLARSDLVAFVKTRLVIDGFDRQIISSGYLVASKPLDGNRWYLFDGSIIKSVADLQSLFEGFPEKARLPEISHKTVLK